MDLLQVLWFPQPYSGSHVGPRLLLFWRDSATLSRDHVLSPTYDVYDYFYVVNECQINPEIITEYPQFHTLPLEHQASFTKMQKRHAGDTRYDYKLSLSTAPGFKVGGYPTLSSLQTYFPSNALAEEEINLLTLNSPGARGSRSDRGVRWQPQSRIFELESPTGTTLICNINIFLNTTTWEWRVIEAYHCG